MLCLGHLFYTKFALKVAWKHPKTSIWIQFVFSLLAFLSFSSFSSWKNLNLVPRNIESNQHCLKSHSSLCFIQTTTFYVAYCVAYFGSVFLLKNVFISKLCFIDEQAVKTIQTSSQSLLTEIHVLLPKYLALISVSKFALRFTQHKIRKISNSAWCVLRAKLSIDLVTHYAARNVKRCRLNNTLE